MQTPAPHPASAQETAITSARRSTSAKLRGLELPDCFAAATIAAEANILARTTRRAADRADLRRIADKARKLEGTVA